MPKCWFFLIISLVALGFMLALAGPAFAHALPPDGVSHEPTAKDLARVREQLAQARSVLPKLAGLGVPESERRALAERVHKAEEALSRYERLAARGKPRQRAQDVLYTAGFVLVADDASGVGALDNVLLPLLAVGALATLILTQPLPSLPELGQAWMNVVAAMEAVGQGAERLKEAIRAAAQPRVIPARSQCQKHYERCQETYLGKPHSASWGESICHACWDQCKNSKFWPDVLDSGKPCAWWSEDWWNSLPHGSESQRSTR